MALVSIPASWRKSHPHAAEDADLCLVHARQTHSLSREDDSPAAVDVRVERYASHVGFAREVGHFVSDLERPRPATHTVAQLAATVMAVAVRHHNVGRAQERGGPKRRQNNQCVDPKYPEKYPGRERRARCLKTVLTVSPT